MFGESPIMQSFFENSCSYPVFIASVKLLLNASLPAPYFLIARKEIFRRFVNIVFRDWVENFLKSAHWHIHNENIIVTQGTLLIGGENDAKGTPVRAGEYLHVPAKFIYWATCAEQDCVVYLNNEGADSYIDVKERRPD